MTLAEIPPAEVVFIDANVFIYHFAGQSGECTAFLSRVEIGELRAVTGQAVILEVAHRLMVLEALEQGLRVGSNPAARLARQPELVQRLSKYYFSALKIPQMGVETLPLATDILARSQEYRQSFGLLLNDSLIPAQMRVAGASWLASADAVFDRVPWIRRAAPADL